MSPPEEPNRFVERYRTVGDQVLVQIEKQVIGTDYGASGYTTLEQADELATALDLDPDKTLLDVGSGPGWPGLYLGAKTGCRVIATEPTTEGVLVASERARIDGLDASAIVSEGHPLPLRDRSVGAVTSGDAFC